MTMDVQTALKTWNAARADLGRLDEKLLNSDDTADNLSPWLEELNDIRDRLDDSSKILAAHYTSGETENRIKFLSIVDQMLANIDKSRDDMRTHIAGMN